MQFHAGRFLGEVKRFGLAIVPEKVIFPETVAPSGPEEPVAKEKRMAVASKPFFARFMIRALSLTK